MSAQCPACVSSLPAQPTRSRHLRLWWMGLHCLRPPENASTLQIVSCDAGWATCTLFAEEVLPSFVGWPQQHCSPDRTGA